MNNGRTIYVRQCRDINLLIIDVAKQWTYLNNLRATVFIYLNERNKVAFILKHNDKNKIEENETKMYNYRDKKVSAQHNAVDISHTLAFTRIYQSLKLTRIYSLYFPIDFKKGESSLLMSNV